MQKLHIKCLLQQRVSEFTEATLIQYYQKRHFCWDRRKKHKKTLMQWAHLVCRLLYVVYQKLQLFPNEGIFAGSWEVWMWTVSSTFIWEVHLNCIGFKFSCRLFRGHVGHALLYLTVVVAGIWLEGPKGASLAGGAVRETGDLICCIFNFCRRVTADMFQTNTCMCATLCI